MIAIGDITGGFKKVVSIYDNGLMFRGTKPGKNSMY
jgi:hypothetical protein